MTDTTNPAGSVVELVTRSDYPWTFVGVWALLAAAPVMFLAVRGFRVHLNMTTESKQNPAAGNALRGNRTESDQKPVAGVTLRGESGDALSGPHDVTTLYEMADLKTLRTPLRALERSLIAEASAQLDAANEAGERLDDVEREICWFRRASRLTALAGVRIVLDELDRLEALAK